MSTSQPTILVAFTAAAMASLAIATAPKDVAVGLLTGTLADCGR